MDSVFLMEVKRYLDKGFYTKAQFFFIHKGMVAFNIFGIFQLAHTLQSRRG